MIAESDTFSKELLMPLPDVDRSCDNSAAKCFEDWSVVMSVSFSVSCYSQGGREMLTCGSEAMTNEVGPAALAGDAMERYRGFLERLAGRQWPVSMRRHVGISDVVQVAMVRASKAADRYWGDSERNVKAWLKKILLNVIINESRRLRTQSRQFEREQPTNVEYLPKDGSSVSADLLRSELREVVFAALSRIKPQYAAVVQLREFQGLSFGEIGVRLNCSSEAVRKVWSRAIKSLEDELTAYAQHNG